MSLDCPSIASVSLRFQMFINHEVEMYCCRQQIYCIVVNSVVGDASLCFAFVDFWWRRSLDVLQLCKEMCWRNCLVSEMILILQWLGLDIHSLCKSQWFFIGYFIRRRIDFVGMTENAWIFLPLHIASAGDANVRNPLLASWGRLHKTDMVYFGFSFLGTKWCTA